MEALIFFLLWAGMVFFMVRHGYGTHAVDYAVAISRKRSGEHERRLGSPAPSRENGG